MKYCSRNSEKIGEVLPYMVMWLCTKKTSPDWSWSVLTIWQDYSPVQSSLQSFCSLRTGLRNTNHRDDPLCQPTNNEDPLDCSEVKSWQTDFATVGQFASQMHLADIVTTPHHLLRVLWHSTVLKFSKEVAPVFELYIRSKHFMKVNSYNIPFISVSKSQR